MLRISWIEKICLKTLFLKGLGNWLQGAGISVKPLVAIAQTFYR